MRVCAIVATRRTGLHEMTIPALRIVTRVTAGHGGTSPSSILAILLQGYIRRRRSRHWVYAAAWPPVATPIAVPALILEGIFEAVDEFIHRVHLHQSSDSAFPQPPTAST
jgi:hypothetical protein